MGNNRYIKLAPTDTALLEKLTEPHRQILVMAETLSTKAMASQLEVAEGTVKSRLNRAREALFMAREKAPA